ncbi:class I SAM-dependent methyltransferase [Haloechinothrix sp. LS1_15]|uniref:class I SAM-dependent methyltransferase n=1 Tax=Haloechinothrix sp. LS1_15 TaxID=2652248 RepID=UPI002947874B|nr:class I SAM-dependent methyltransferase [Haloechinothrix sp. LS1_15]MDV6012385.1 class I SAM-dependent methyltransferase [Haloechinothrix sp. LS1_15]
MQRRLRRAVRSRLSGAAHRLADLMAERVTERMYAEQRAENERLRNEVSVLRELTEQRLDKLQVDLVAEHERQVDRAIDRVGQFEWRSRHDMVFAGDREAASESSRFTYEHFTGRPHFTRPWETLQYGLSLAPQGGLALEFGVATGNTLRQIAERRGDGRVYGFDSFQGLPEAWLPGIGAGSFASEQLPEVAGAELVVGWFADTVPEFLAAHPEPVDFVHIDSDIYSAAVTVLDHVGPRLRPGSVLVFDEFLNYPGWQQHEYRAWCEFVERTGVAFRYEAYTYQDRQVVVRLC